MRTKRIGSLSVLEYKQCEVAGEQEKAGVWRARTQHRTLKSLTAPLSVASAVCHDYPTVSLHTATILDLSARPVREQAVACTVAET